MSESTGTSFSGVSAILLRSGMAGRSGESMSVAIMARVASGAYCRLIAMTDSACRSNPGSWKLFPSMSLRHS